MKPPPQEPWSWNEDRAGYRVWAEVVEDEARGCPVVVGLTIRRLTGEPLSRVEWWPRRGPFKPLSLRDVRRLPLPTILARARAAGSVMFEARRRAPETGEGVTLDAHEYVGRVRRARAPRGRPQRGRSTAFYLELLRAYRDLVASGVEHPGVELARRKRQKPNTIYQWLYRARKLEQGD